MAVGVVAAVTAPGHHHLTAVAIRLGLQESVGVPTHHQGVETTLLAGNIVTVPLAESHILRTNVHPVTSPVAAIHPAKGVEDLLPLLMMDIGAHTLMTLIRLSVVLRKTLPQHRMLTVEAAEARHQMISVQREEPGCPQGGEGEGEEEEGAHPGSVHPTALDNTHLGLDMVEVVDAKENGGKGKICDNQQLQRKDTATTDYSFGFISGTFAR